LSGPAGFLVRLSCPKGGGLRLRVSRSERG
jgi:hypothetical protein